MNTVTHVQITPKGGARGSYGNYDIALMNGNTLLTHANSTSTKMIDAGNHRALAIEVLYSNDIDISDYNLDALQESDEE